MGSLAVSARGILYSVYADDRRRSSLGNYTQLDSLHNDVYLSRSTDNGLT